MNAINPTAMSMDAPHAAKPVLFVYVRMTIATIPTGIFRIRLACKAGIVPLFLNACDDVGQAV